MMFDEGATATKTIHENSMEIDDDSETIADDPITVNEDSMNVYEVKNHA